MVFLKDNCLDKLFLNLSVVNDLNDRFQKRLFIFIL